MPITAKRIALFGNFGSDNIGNEASLTTMLDFIRRSRPNVNVTCICPGVERARAQHGVAAIPIKLPSPKFRWLAVLDRLLVRLPSRLVDFAHTLYVVRNFDLFLIPGTGILDDFSERWHAMPFDLFKWGVAARLNGRPLALVSAGAGPIRHTISRKLMIFTAGLASYRSYRDKASRDFMQAEGVSTENDFIFPDLAFNLPIPRPSKTEAQDAQSIVGVGIMHYYGWDRDSPCRSSIHETYLVKLTEFVCWLVEKGYRVRLLMGALSDQQSIEEVWRRAIIRGGQQAASRLSAEPAYSLQELMDQIGDTELIVATRFHNIVAALKMGKPAISLGYADKNEVLLKEVGLDAFCQHIECLDIKRLIADFEKLFDQRDEFRERIFGAMKEFGSQLDRQERYLLENLL